MRNGTLHVYIKKLLTYCMDQSHNTPHTNPEVPEEKKDALTKTFAIAGFAAIIIFIVWLAVQVVSVIPGAFSSLASLAESVYHYDVNQELVITNDNAVVNAGESFTLTWSELSGAGSYSFSYACTEGVALEVKIPTGEVTSQACDTSLDLGKATSLSILVASGKFRFVDVPMTITYTRDNNSAEGTKKTAKTITIVNATIPTEGIVTAPATEVTSTPEVTKPVTTPVSKPTTKPTYTTVPKVTYTTPVSNPNGFTDLQTTYFGLGTVSGSKFTPVSALDLSNTDGKASMQFEVKNIGTKTSNTWQYVAHLPSGVVYTSPAQLPLKPNERAIITLGINGLSEDGIEKVSVSVSSIGESKITNNGFEKTVNIVK